VTERRTISGSRLSPTNTNQISFNNEFGQETEFGKCLINSAADACYRGGSWFVAMSVRMVFFRALGWDEINCQSAFAGDTLIRIRKCWRSANPSQKSRNGGIIKSGGTSRHPAGGENRHRLRAQRHGVDERAHAPPRDISESPIRNWPETPGRPGVRGSALDGVRVWLWGKRLCPARNANQILAEYGCRIIKDRKPGKGD